MRCASGVQMLWNPSFRRLQVLLRDRETSNAADQLPHCGEDASHPLAVVRATRSQRIDPADLPLRPVNCSSSAGVLPVPWSISSAARQNSSPLVTEVFDLYLIALRAIGTPRCLYTTAPGHVGCAPRSAEGTGCI